MLKTWTFLESNNITDKLMNTEFYSEALKDGEYYIFSKKEKDRICIGYTYTTWCGSPCGMRMEFVSVEIGSPLQLTRTGDSKSDKGQLKAFAFDRRNPALINDVYNRAMHWLQEMRKQQKYPQLDITENCTIAVIQISEGILSSLSET